MHKSGRRDGKRVKVVVTGGSGFLGSHIADALSAAGHETVIFDVAPSPWLQPDQTMVVGSVLDPDKIASACAAAMQSII